MAGELKIPGLKETTDEIVRLQNESQKLLDLYANLIKENDKASVEYKKGAKSITDVSNAFEKQAKSEEASALARLKLEKASKDLLIQEERLAKAKIATESAAKRLETQTNKVSAAKRKATTDTNTWGKALDSFQFKFNALGNFMAVGFLAAIGGVVGAFKTVIGWNNEYTKALNSLGAITGLRGKDLKDLGEIGREMGLRLNMSATDMLGAYEKVGSLLPVLLKNKQALADVTEQAVLLSKASGGKLGLTESTAAVGAVMNQFGLESNQAARIVNALAAAEVEGSASTMDLTESLKNVGAVASGANVSFEQTSALLEILASKQIVGAEAGTKLRGAILKLQDAGIGYKSGVFNINDALKELQEKLKGKTTAQEKDTEILKVFGIENATAGRILLDNISNYETLTSKITGTSTALEQATLQTDNATAEWNKLLLLLQDAATGNTFEGINKGLAKSARATISVIGGIAGYLFQYLRVLGEEIYNVFDIGAIIDGTYLQNFEKSYKAFLERQAGYAELIINPLGDYANATKKGSDEAVKIIEENEQKITNALTDQQKKRIELYKKYVDEDRESKDALNKKEEKALDNAINKELEKIKKQNEEKAKAYSKYLEDIKKLDEETQKIKEETDAENYEKTKEAIQEQYDEEINSINDQYAAKLEAAQGNEQLIQEADAANKEAIYNAEVAHWTAMLLIATKGSQDYNNAVNALSDLRLKKAQENADKEVKISKWMSDTKYKIKMAEVDAIEGIGNLLAVLAKKDSALAKAAFIVQKAAAIAKVWTSVAASNAIIEAEAAALAIPTAGASEVLGASLILKSNINAGIQTAIIAAQGFAELQGFAKGTSDAPGGPAIVGEKGTELIKFPDGTMSLTPNYSTFLPNLPKHSEVIPHHLVQEELQQVAKMPEVINRQDNEKMINLLQAIHDKPSMSFSIDRSGIHVISKKGQRKTKWLDKRYRGYA